MFRPSQDSARLAEAYRLGLVHDTSGGQAGARLGKGTGSSLEFQDRRDYAAGDDIRHLDWRTFARTNQLQVKLYREEITPRVELFVDDSRSMQTDTGKAQQAVDMVSLLAQVARADGFQVVLIALGDSPATVPLDRFQNEGLRFEARTTIQDSLHHARSFLRPGSLRFVVSDFLSPHDAPSLVRPLSSRAGSLALLQVLSTADARPEIGRALRLVDAETEEEIELVLDATSVARYHERLRNLMLALAEETRRGRGCLATLEAREPLEVHCREALLPLGILATS